MHASADAPRADEIETRPIIVAVGASAGGLEAFQTLVATFGPKDDLALVLVQHLDPDHQSLLAELLSKRTNAPVAAILDDQKVEAGRIYLIPPGASITIEDGRLRLHSFTAPRGLRRPIDQFFESLAKDRGQDSVGIVLSGTGSDGSIGAKAIKQAGGLVLAQVPRTAKYDGMPRSALETGAVDLALPVADMVNVVKDYCLRKRGLEPEIGSDEDFIRRVTKHVLYRTGHDFSDYKRPTLLRRIARRMSVLELSSPAEYVQRLVADNSEAAALFQDLLINVTYFFRDPDTFETLNELAIPEILNGRGPADEIRIWVPGCSTGQEAYSIAMLVAAELERTDSYPRVNIFATDIDDTAIKLARDAVYPSSIADQVPADFLNRYFSIVSEGYRVTQKIRDMVRFSTHGLVKDPPFAKLDLISCRNLIIYFDRTLQSRVFPIFHYALKPDGFLFLGPSENVSEDQEFFSETHASHRLFRRRPGHARPLAMQIGAGRRSNELQQAPDPTVAPDRAVPHAPYMDAILARHTPAFVVANATGELSYVAEGANRFLSFPQGAPRLDLARVVNPQMRRAVRRLLSREALVGEPIHTRFAGEIGGIAVRLTISLELLPDSSRLIVFQDRFDPTPTDPPVSADPIQSNEDRELYIQTLEDELESARQTIRTTIEELETSNEELKSSNEEMMSMNEELQSANEELSTVNEELQNKVSELNDVNADLKNYIEGTRVAAIFLNNNLGVRNFTPDAMSYFRLVEHDKGRALADIASSLSMPDLLSTASQVLKDGKTRDLDLQTADGQSELQVRILPYIAHRDEQDGVVMTFVPVTELRQYARRLEQTEAQAKRQLAEIEELYKTLPQAMGLFDRDFRYVRVNDRLAQINGAPAAQHIGKTATDIVPLLGEQVIKPMRDVLLSGEPILAQEVIGQTAGAPGQTLTWEVDWYPVRHDRDIVAIGVSVRDVTRYKTMEAELRQLMRELQHRVKNMLGNVTALVNRARRETDDPLKAMDSLVRRIQALADTHDLLTTKNWGSVALRDVLRLELSNVYGGERVGMRGPEVIVDARAAVAIGMTVHELATNAAKYGAFSNETGQLTVNWMKIDEGEDERLVLKWKEAGGPSVSAPATSGFGTKLIQSMVEGSLRGRLDFAFESTGFICSIDVPLAQVTASHQPDTALIANA
ncbi:MAG: CheR family methyltransferase [Pseudomonadota bacterium]